MHLFKSSSSRITVANIKEDSVQQLLINSCLLITDYSSVFFDFAYMEKPVIYYQFDYNNYRNYHYQEGYFSYEKDGFGPVAYDEKKLILYIESYIKNQFKIKKDILNRINHFFPIRDQNNCKRILNEIKKLN